MKQFLKFFATPVIAALLSGVIVAWATQTNYLGTVFIADTTTPTNQLKVNADGSINISGGGSGLSVVDESVFTGGTSPLAPTGGFFQTTATSNPLTNGQQGMWQMTAYRAGMIALFGTDGVSLGGT